MSNTSTATSAVPALLRRFGRTGARLAFSGALAVGLLATAPTTDARAASDPVPVLTSGSGSGSSSSATPTKTAPTKAERRARARHAARVRTARKIGRAVGVAVHKKGDPYAYGAAGPHRFDCSGLTFYSFRRAGFHHIPRTSSAQAHWARHVKRTHMHRGDLIFFSNGGHVYHVGIFAGRKHGRVLVLHAPYSGARVRVDRIWTNAWFAGTLRHR